MAETSGLVAIPQPSKMMRITFLFIVMKEITKEWIKKAEEDYSVATQTMQFEPTVFDIFLHINLSPFLSLSDMEYQFLSLFL